MLLSVIIVSYNTKDLTIQTLESTVKDIQNSKLLKNNSEIIVIDNNSSDKSIVAIKNFKQKTKVSINIITQKENLGFGKANNLGIKKSSGKYILLLNSDTIIQKNALKTMVNRFENQVKNKIKSLETINNVLQPSSSIKKLGILSATLLNSDLTLQPQGGSLPNLANLFVHMIGLDDLPIIGNIFSSTQDTGKNSKQFKHYSLDDQKISLKEQLQNNKLINIDWVGGTAMMIPKSALDEFGTLDPNIFMYGEDMEICLRAKNHHYQVAIDPSAKIIHLKNQSSSSENAIKGEFKGYRYIFSKHYNSTTTELAKIILQIGAILRIIAFSTFAKNKYKKTIYNNVLKDLNK